MVTKATPSTASCLPSTSFTRASKSSLARSGIRYAAMTTSNSRSLMGCSVRAVRRAGSFGDASCGVGLGGVGVQGELVVGVEVRSDVEHDLLDGSGERERCLVGVAAVDGQAVVPADVHARVAGELERHRVVHAAAADLLAVDVEGDLAGGGRCGCVGGEGQLDGDVTGREDVGRLLLVLEHAEEGVGVLELAVLHEQGVAAEVAAVGDDDP